MPNYSNPVDSNTNATYNNGFQNVVDRAWTTDYFGTSDGAVKVDIQDLTVNVTITSDDVVSIGNAISVNVTSDDSIDVNFAKQSSNIAIVIATDSKVGNIAFDGDVLKVSLYGFGEGSAGDKAVAVTTDGVVHVRPANTTDSPLYVELLPVDTDSAIDARIFAGANELAATTDGYLYIAALTTDSAIDVNVISGPALTSDDVVSISEVKSNITINPLDTDTCIDISGTITLNSDVTIISTLTTASKIDVDLIVQSVAVTITSDDKIDIANWAGLDLSTDDQIDAYIFGQSSNLVVNVSSDSVIELTSDDKVDAYFYGQTSNIGVIITTDSKVDAHLVSTSDDVVCISEIKASVAVTITSDDKIDIANWSGLALTTDDKVDVYIYGQSSNIAIVSTTDNKIDAHLVSTSDDVICVSEIKAAVDIFHANTYSFGIITTTSDATQCSNVACNWVEFQAHASNTGVLWVGDSDVSGTAGFLLNAGESTGKWPVANLSTFYHLGDGADGGLCVVIGK